VSLSLASLALFSCAGARRETLPVRCLVASERPAGGHSPPPVASGPGPDANFLSDWSATGRYGNGAPTRLSVSPDGGRVYFLRSGPRSAVRDLYVLDATERTARVLVSAESILRGAEEQLSPEERARRERQRQSGRGIASYALSPDGASALVPLSGRLFVVDVRTGQSREIASRIAGAPVDPRWSPDGRMIAAVRGGELVVTDVATGVERALTSGAGAGISHGTAEFVAQEEMDRMEGYWWSGDGRALAFQETDERGVEQLRVSDPSQPEREPEVNRYPRAGRANAVVRLGVVPVTAGAPRWIEWDRERYPYLARVAWPPRGPLTVVVQNRAQSEVVVLAADPTTGRTRPLHVERDAAWVNLDPHLPRWLEDGSGWLWVSERDGHATLELRGPDGALVRTLGAEARYRALLSVDDAARVAYVSGGEEPSETQVFKLDLGSGRAERLTQGRAEHDMTFARAGGARAHSRAPIDGPRTWTFERGDGTPIAEIPSVAEEPRVPPAVELRTVGAPAWRAAVVRPRGFVQGRRYPVIDAVYGGPGSRQVTSARNRYAMSQWLADHGFIVVSLDGRGTPFRGRDWERALRGRLDEVPLEEQAAGLAALGAEIPEMDLSRVGVYGWSFGGYLAGLAVQRRPEVFHAAVSGAPVTDWRDYDTHYTERFMGLPDAERTAYDRSSLVLHAEALTRPLLLVHGTADDNVYYTHAARWSDALFRAGRAHEFLPLTGFTHMVADPTVNRRLYERVARFFVEHLRPR
jgi:dipeptidyl-peptidase-4